MILPYELHRLNRCVITSVDGEILISADMPHSRPLLSDFLNTPPEESENCAPLISVTPLQPLSFHDMIDCLSTPTRSPLVKRFMTIASRLKSYGSLFVCPKSPEELSENGFYWLGPWIEPGITVLDHVRCFWCKTTLLCWEENDDVAEEHMKVRPDCPFARVKVVRPPTSEEKKSAISMWKDTQRVRYLRRHGIPPHLIFAALEDIYDNKYPFPDSVGLLKAVGRVLERSVSTNTPETRVDTCKVCLVRQVSIVFVPCGHLACCMPCSREFLSCPVCKESVKGRVVVRLT